MSRKLRFTPAARADLERLYESLAQKDLAAARRALDTIDEAWGVIRKFPFACRKATAGNPFLRELLISFGNSGYVALYEIEGEGLVTVLAVRHQREDDYH